MDALKPQGAESPGTAASGPVCDTKHLCQSKGREARLLRHWPQDSPFTPLMWLRVQLILVSGSPWDVWLSWAVRTTLRGITQIPFFQYCQIQGFCVNPPHFAVSANKCIEIQDFSPLEASRENSKQ